MDWISLLAGNVGLGFATAFSLDNLFYCFVGVLIGMLVGVLPGIGALSAIAMLFPLTFSLHPTTALIMLAGIYYGTAYGGSTAAILLNVPGSSSSAVSCIDGYPMSKQGRGGIALLMTTVASFIAGSFGILVMMFFSPLIVNVALEFGSAEYFALMALGLVAASSVADGSFLKGIAMVLFGIVVGLVGIDMYTNAQRFEYGFLELSDGVSLVALAMGLFGTSEVIASIGEIKDRRISQVTMRSMIPTRDDVKRSKMPILRGTLIGSFFGALPGTGPTVASFMAYGLEKKIAQEPSRFGKGAIEGVVSPEAANNAADQTAFIPTMTLGIPGSATMALMLGVLMIHGIQPGPLLMVEKPDMFWGLVMSFWIGNVILVFLNIPLIGLWIRLLQIPYRYLYPAILMFVCIGVYAVNNSVFDLWIMLIFAVAGFILRKLDFPVAPVLLGFILGPMMEEHFRRAMLMARGDFLIFFERPISATLMLITFAIVAWGIWTAFRGPRKALDPQADAQIST